MSDSQLINDQLKNIYVNLATLQGTQINAMTKQTNMKNMITSENERLLQKKGTIDQAVDNQKRIIYFNDNSRKISLAYLRILMTIAVSLAMIYLVRVIFFHFTYLPNMLFNVLMILITSTGIIVSFNYYLSIIYRDPYNFDELRLSDAKMAATPQTDKGDKLGVGSLTGCVASICCTPATSDAPGTAWDEALGRCVYSPPSGMPTTIPQSTEPSVPSFSPEPFYSPV